MSRSGYSYDCSHWELIRYRGQVASATRGRRGQALLLDILRGMDAMAVKELHADVLKDDNDRMCAMGAACQHRGVNLEGVDVYSPGDVGDALNVARQLAAEIAFENDEGCFSYWDPNLGTLVGETPAKRWTRMFDWVLCQLTSENRTAYERERGR